MNKKENIKKFLNKNIKYTIVDAFDILKKISNNKFNESIEASIHFHVIPKKNIIIKGYSTLPYNFGKKMNPVIFSSSNVNYDCPVIDENNLDKINKKMKFNIILSAPSDMIKLSKINKILNGKKIMPDPKYGTVTTNFADILQDLSSNYLRFKLDKDFSINLIIGKMNFTHFNLKQNLEKIIFDIKKSKPQNCKNISVKKIILSSTMGPGININIDSINC